MNEKKCRSVEWYTPSDVVEAARKTLGVIELDPATAPHNPVGALEHYSSGGLEKPWTDGTFVNPPYGSGFDRWCEKIALESAYGYRILALLPCGARFSTKYFQKYVLSSRLTWVVFFNRRLAFTGPYGERVGTKNIYDSALWCYNIESVCAFGGLGKVVKCQTKN